jgi:hypothetical protein
MRLFVLFYFLKLSVFAQLDNKVIRDLKTGKIIDDKSHVYFLPYEKGEKYLLIQASNSQMSHKNEVALDFKMKKGSKICAARGGKVVALRKDSQVGGLKQEYLSEGNYIIIEHEDGSHAKYWHLDYQGVFVEIGETVKQGQPIGLSGHTGYSAFPHLHFELTDIEGKQILCRFKTKKGNIYLRPARKYTCVH